MKYLPNESNMNKKRRSSFFKRDLKTPKNTNPLLLFSNLFKKIRKSLKLINNQQKN